MKIKLHIEETARYLVEVEVPDDVAYLDEENLYEWLIEDMDDNPRYFELINKQKPDWATTCCVSIESRELL